MDTETKPREVIVSFHLQCDYTEMLQEMEADMGESLEGEELREYLWELFANSFGDLTRKIDKDSIDILINGTPQP